MARLLLLSGGVDSAALASWTKFDAALTINYGQRPAIGELRAASAIADALALSHDSVQVDASAVGSGLLAGRDSLAMSPASEWWPFRNQLLITIAAAYAVANGFFEVSLGTVASDGDRHKDGQRSFFANVDRLVAAQEGNVRVTAPAVELSAAQLLQRSGLPREVLSWAHSCHRANYACGDCPGCWKRAELLATD